MTKTILRVSNEYYPDYSDAVVTVFFCKNWSSCRPMSEKNEEGRSMGRGEKLWTEILCLALHLHRLLRLLLYTLAFIQLHLISFWNAAPLSSDGDLNCMRWTFDLNRANQHQPCDSAYTTKKKVLFLLETCNYRYNGYMSSEMILEMFAWKWVHHRKKLSQR